MTERLLRLLLLAERDSQRRFTRAMLAGEQATEVSLRAAVAP